MENLLKYIKSTFNKKVDVDAVEFSKNSCLLLYNKPVCNVYVTPLLFPELVDLEDEYLALVEKSICILNNITKEKTTFRLTDTIYGANIKLYWAKTTRRYSGLQFYEGTYTNINNPSVSIGVMEKDGYIYSSSEVLAIILHEFGHILGLGHSPNKKDLMCAEWNPEVQNFSKNDRFVLDLIYSIGNGQSYSNYEEMIYQKVLAFKNGSKNETEIGTKKIFDDLNYIADINKLNMYCQNKDLQIKRIYQTL